jgi:hypothetical protein
MRLLLPGLARLVYNETSASISLRATGPHPGRMGAGSPVPVACRRGAARPPDPSLCAGPRPGRGQRPAARPAGVCRVQAERRTQDAGSRGIHQRTVGSPGDRGRGMSRNRAG